MLAGVFVNRLATFLQLFLVLFLTQYRHFSPGKAGLALGVWGAGAVLGTIIGGYLSDRLSPRSATLISMVGSAVLLVALVYLKVYLLILLVVLLIGGVSVIYRPAAQAMITETAPEGQLVMVTAMYRLCLNLGTTAAPVIGVALSRVSYGLLFWAEAVAAVLYALIALRYLPRRPKADKSEAGQAAAEAAAKEEQPKAGYRALLADPRYLVFLLAFLLLCVVYCQYTVILPLAIIKAGLSTWWYGSVITMNAVIVVTCEVLATKWTQRWPLRLTQMSGFALLAIGYGIYSIKTLPVFVVLGTLTWTLSEIVGTPTVYAYPGMVAPAHLRGRYYGAMQSMFSLGTALGPVGGVFLFEHVGQRAFVYAAAIAVVATVVGAIGMSGPRSTAVDPAEAQEAAEAVATVVAADAEPFGTEPPGLVPPDAVSADPGVASPPAR
jgi:predicted MFS family arabinose efflux permease